MWVGVAWGAVYIPGNFSAYLPLRQDPQYMFDQTIFNESTIHLTMDMSDFAIATFIGQRVESAFEATMSQFLANVSLPAYLGQLPLQVHTSV